MADHLQYSSSTGHLLYGPNGHLAHTCGGDPCEHCEDGTPKTLRVVFSGVTLCACLADTYGDYSRQVIGELDGTYDLTQDEYELCLWRVAHSLIVRTWDESTDCTGDYWDMDADQFYDAVWVRKTAAGWEISVQVGYLFLESANVFYATATGTNCESDLPADVPNELPACSPIVYSTDALATGGTATVSIP